MPTKYTQVQRNEMYRLYREGLQPMEVSRRMAEGSGGLPPLDIPRKSVESIVKTMQSKTNQRRQAERETEDPREQAQRIRRRIQITIENEIDRIEVAQGNGKPVDPKRLHELAKAVKVLSSPDPGRPRGPASSNPETPGTPNEDGRSLAAMAARNPEAETDETSDQRPALDDLPEADVSPAVRARETLAELKQYQPTGSAHVRTDVPPIPAA